MKNESHREGRDYVSVSMFDGAIRKAHQHPTGSRCRVSMKNESYREGRDYVSVLMVNGAIRRAHQHPTG
ncbi:hypothetical protein EH243_02365 [Amphritea opalescens]|uniref:Uncharacterized protein n=1 Tax=Amphritea opalescens TaxID=2490544 RepID=A0A430KUB2_9GAMM|nr:hypothetical protein [Amphritea opalescens]RTE67077.1 hypothetical protein EH243_02365 [Amphritea opalescens]